MFLTLCRKDEIAVVERNLLKISGESTVTVSFAKACAGRQPILVIRNRISVRKSGQHNEIKSTKTDPSVNADTCCSFAARLALSRYSQKVWKDSVDQSLVVPVSSSRY